MDSEEIVTEIAKKLMRIYSKDYDWWEEKDYKDFRDNRDFKKTLKKYPLSIPPLGVMYNMLNKETE
jgi:hypothetical protein